MIRFEQVLGKEETLARIRLREGWPSAAREGRVDKRKFWKRARN